VQQQFEAQDTDYRRTRPQATFEVIEVDGRPAGRLYLDRREGTIHVIDIALLPPFRGRGVGTRLLYDLMVEADGSGRALEIHVERLNPARRLYERLGFRDVEEGPVYILMERPPAARG
jgi:ribosomal protein S18 acetylase RimI-like enzyme